MKSVIAKQCGTENAALPLDGAFHQNAMADLKNYGSHDRIQSYEVSSSHVAVTWYDGHLSYFHHGWLRENCPSPTSRHPTSMERLIHPLSIPVTIQPLSVSLDSHGALAIIWPTANQQSTDAGHRSLYTPGWLRAHCYTLSPEPGNALATPISKGREPLRGDWQSLMDNEEHFFKWLSNMDEMGWSVVSGVPNEDGACIKFGQKIGVIRSSNFGFSFDVRSKPNPNSNAYTSYYLPLHTDMPHYELPPGFQLLHCRINSASGGESLLSDGLNVAIKLKESHPDAYNILCSETIPYRFQDADSDYTARHPLIECDHHKIPRYINWSNSTSAPLDVPPSRMEKMREAIRLFVAQLEHPDHLITIKLQPGEMLAFNNRRILHGRNGFDTSSGDRFFQGCYLDSSELKSRIAVLARTCKQ